MHPVLILAIAVCLVLVGILVFRLHAFLTLTLAALVVAWLTPASAVQRYHLERNAVPVVEQATEGGSGVVLLQPGRQVVQAGMRFLVVRRGPSGGLDQVAQLEIASAAAATATKPYPSDLVAARVVDSATADVQPGDLVVHPFGYREAVAASETTIGERVATAFGTTCGKIGILIALAAIIGKCLLDSGAADRIVRSALRVVGQRGAPFAFVGSGFLLGIPVFFDTVFYLMMPLGKAMRMRVGANYLLYILTIVAGASMAHSLVPPTPGPLLVAGELGVDLGILILAGCCVGVFSSTAAYLFARFVNHRWEVPLRESADFSLRELEELTERDESQLPPLFLSLSPIVLPVVLIAGNAVLDEAELLAPGSLFESAAETLGNKNIALGIGTAIAMLTLVWQKRSSLKHLAGAMQAALASGGVIILITAAGGAFGAMLQQTGIVDLIRGLPPYSPLMVLVLAFLTTTAIRTAQGSATVAMITAVGILASFAADGQLGCHPVYLALAIGCGSKPIAWMNDSGFWVICKMSGMTEAEGLRFITPMSILMGLAGLAATLLGAALLPMN